MDTSSEIGALQSTVLQLQNRLNSNVEVIERYNRIRSSLVSLLLEFRDTTQDDPNFPPDPRVLREQYLALSPLVVIDRLRASLHSLLKLKNDYEGGITKDLSTRATTQEATLRDISEKYMRTQEELESVRAELDTLRVQQSTFRDREQQAQAKFEAEREKMRFSITKALSEQQRLEQDKTELKAQLQKADAMIHERDNRLIRVAQLEAQLQQLDHQSKFELAKARSENKKEISDLKSRQKSQLTTEAELTKANEEIQLLRTKLHSYTSNFTAKSVEGLNKKLAQAKMENEQLTKKISQIETDRMELQHQKDELKKELLLMREVGGTHTSLSHDISMNAPNLANTTFGKKTTKIDKEVPKSREKEINEETVNQVMEKHIIATYKARLAQRDAEVNELAQRVRRLLTLQHRSALAQRAWAEEKSRLERQLSNLREEISHARKNMNGMNGLTSGIRIGSGEIAGNSATEAILNSFQNNGFSAEGSDPDSKGIDIPNILKNLQNLRAFSSTAVISSNDLPSENQQLNSQKKDKTNSRGNYYSLETVTIPKSRGGGIIPEMDFMKDFNENSNNMMENFDRIDFEKIDVNANDYGISAAIERPTTGSTLRSGASLSSYGTRGSSRPLSAAVIGKRYGSMMGKQVQTKF